MGTFSAQILAWCEKTKDDADKIVRRSLQTLDGRINFRSPVGDPSKWATPLTKSRKTGRMHFNGPVGYVGGAFRRNWQMSIGSPATGVLPGQDPNGKITKAEHDAIIAIAKAGQIQFLVNNSPYAIRLEEGWSRQAPYGMVALAVVEWDSIVANAVNGVVAGGGNMAAGFEAYPI